MGLLWFDTKTVMAQTDISLRQLNHWDRLGIASPSIQPAQGSGSRRRYSAEDVFLLLLARTLRNAQVPLQSVRDALSAVRAQGIGLHCDLDTLLLCAGDQVTYLGRDRRRIHDELGRAPAVFVLNVGRLAARAVELTAARALPAVEVVEVVGQALQVVITPRAQECEARCNAHPGCVGTGPTTKEAIDALKLSVEGTSAGSRPRKRPRKRLRKLRASPPSGASAWGDAW